MLRRHDSLSLLAILALSFLCRATRASTVPAARRTCYPVCGCCRARKPRRESTARQALGRGDRGVQCNPRRSPERGAVERANRRPMGPRTRETMAAERILPTTATLALALASAVAFGCQGTGRIDVYTCNDPCGNGQPGYTCEDPCGECRGQCIPLPPLDFEGPMIVYIGPQEGAPECPAHAPIKAYEGLGDLRDETFYCPPCECSEPACVLPEGITASDLSVCPNDPPGATLTPFSAPASWDGSCTSPGTVDASQLGSVTIAPVRVRPCEPIVEVVPDWEFYPLWNTFARACRGQVNNGRCEDPALICMPTAEPPPPGFRQCIAAQAELGQDLTCPDTYPIKFTFYAGANDTRACTECVCDQVPGAGCSAWVSLFGDNLCNVPILSTGLDSLSAMPACADISMQGATLGSMEAFWMENEPGTCTPSGGDPVGEVVPEDPKVFCCQPPP